ncbi:MAG: Flp pilus assembly protein CpaB [Cyanobacteria bacterium REEB65]|nr:Flp pilus assembly protein CpaB [Cyanobacteria bacterium REEB65]
MALSVPRMAVATAIGLSTSFALFLLITHQQAAAKAAEGPRTGVLVVQQGVSGGSPIEASAIALKFRPSQYVPSGSLADPRNAVGRIAREDLVPGEVLLDGLLFPPGQDAATTVLPVPVGKRAVTVAVDEVVGVAGFVMPGSRVDVVGTLDVNDQPVTRVLLQDIQVLAIAQDAKRQEDPQAKIVSSATLAVSPKQAEILILAADRGKIRLAMRGDHETQDLHLAAVTPASIFGRGISDSRGDQPGAQRARSITRVVVDREHSRTRSTAILVIRGTTTELVNRDDGSFGDQ